MSKRPVENAVEQGLPYAELVIKPTDSRPIVFAVYGGEDSDPSSLTVSAGNARDCWLAAKVIRAIEAVNEITWQIRSEMEEGNGEPPF